MVKQNVTDQAEKTAETRAEPNAPKYTKQQMLESKRFGPQQKDVLFALLADEESYTISRAELMIADFQKGEVE